MDNIDEHLRKDLNSIKVELFPKLNREIIVRDVGFVKSG